MMYMDESKKRLITRESCAKQLRTEALLDCRLYAIALVVVSACCLPLSVYLLKVAANLPFLGIVGALICAAPTVCVSVLLIKRTMTLRQIRQGRFVIVVDDVCRISRGEPQGRSTVDVLYFTRYGRYISGGVYFELTELRDEYYLVVLKGKKTAELAYSKKFYDCDAEEVFFE